MIELSFAIGLLSMFLAGCWLLPRFAGNIFGTESQLEPVAKDGTCLIQQLSARALDCRRRAAFLLVTAILFLTFGGWAVLRLSPFIAAGDMVYWAGRSMLADPTLQDVASESSVFGENVKRAENRRSKQTEKAGKALHQMEQLSLKLEASKEDLANFDTEKIESSIRRNLSEQIARTEESLRQLQQKLISLEEEIVDQTNLAIVEKSESEKSATLVEIRNVENHLSELRLDIDSPEAINDKIRKNRYNLEYAVSTAEQEHEKADRNSQVQNTLLEASEKNYNEAVKEYIALLDRTKGRSSSEWFFASTTILRVLGLGALLFVSWQLIKTQQYLLRLAAFYQSRADLVNSYRINDYDLDVSVADTIKMFAPEEFFASADSSSYRNNRSKSALAEIKKLALVNND